MTFTESISTCFSKYASFDGTASRSEYWWFMLFLFVTSAVVSIVNESLGIVFNLATFIPSIAAACRRLHDTDRSGWLQLLFLVPVIGWIIVIVFLAQESRPNRYSQPMAVVA